MSVNDIEKLAASDGLKKKTVPELKGASRVCVCACVRASGRRLRKSNMVSQVVVVVVVARCRRRPAFLIFLLFSIVCFALLLLLRLPATTSAHHPRNTTRRVAAFALSFCCCRCFAAMLAVLGKSGTGKKADLIERIEGHFE